MARIGVISISDGRDHVHARNAGFIQSKQDALVRSLRAAGHEVVAGSDLVATNTLATSVARGVAAADVDVTVFYYAVWSFPHFTMLAADATRSPLILVASTDPTEPGLVGMLAAGGALDQIGRTHTRLWGAPDDAELAANVGVQARAASAVASLRGSTFGRFGGRPMGMNTAVANTDQWMRQFGIDVEEIDQYELVLRAERADAGEAAKAREWIEANAAGVHYDGKKLTPELLERQIRSYLAIRDIIAERDLDFSGIKGQPELTEHFATMDVTEAVLNDPYDWNGPKDVHVTATEADMDGALTMQLFHKITGTPVLFADVRHYHADRDIWDLCNSGQHATWFAARSDDPAENLAKVNFYPEVFFFPAGGASVQHIAAPGQMTLGRLTRQAGEYRLQLMLGEFESYDDATNDRLMRQSTPEWPHAFARLDAPGEVFLSNFGANHIHAVPGDVRAEMRAAAQLLGVRVDEWTRG
ncbi:L-fucose/L-arabinose isomerase family protein [Amycolatopsis acidiphila]|uniref:FucIase n=1 Tax=Amycolatopsis acidiphila TaxID=715473 RepID=A0A558A0R4_9PSEU|nr:L-fucose/L-arabinose isomerase family protein [Amycolatopsis acidiphila]TVT17849.1 fucose isomerase [Amycolatopsis acidiphila]UIJ62240.1 L-fucose/L-arabinose isomerase family protein [Amycolatopsis acidiphila]GHG92819.1 L-fucose isomerase [Amycolatopsis acidiphila]